MTVKLFVAFPYCLFNGCGICSECSCFLPDIGAQCLPSLYLRWSCQKLIVFIDFFGRSRLLVLLIFFTSSCNVINLIFFISFPLFVLDLFLFLASGDRTQMIDLTLFHFSNISFQCYKFPCRLFYWTQSSRLTALFLQQHKTCCATFSWTPYFRRRNQLSLKFLCPYKKSVICLWLLSRPFICF